jgi:hypothetical protein
VILEWALSVIFGILLAASFCEKTYGADGDTSADARCVVVGLRMASMADPQSHAAGVVMATYYLGRLGARSSNTESEQLIESEAQRITSSEFQIELGRCEQDLVREEQEIQKITADLSRKERGETR